MGHTFKHGDWSITVDEHGLGQAEGPAGTAIDIGAAIAAEVLRLAEELTRARSLASETEGARLVLLAENRRLAAQAAELRHTVGDTERDLRAEAAEQARTIDRLGDDARMSRDVAEAALSDNRLLKGQVAALGSENYALEQKAKRRKAKIRKLEEDLSVIGHQLEAARVLSAQAEREAVLAYLFNVRAQATHGSDRSLVRCIEADIRGGAHLTAPASPPQEPSPAGKSAPE